jgi:hypothetical protein
MQETPISMSHSTSAPAVNLGSNQTQSTTQVDDLVRVFNTALVASRVEAVRDFSTELYALVESQAFRTILNAVRQHARLQGISERQAAEQVIQTFRKVDRLWSDYVFQEGVDRLRNQMG